MLRPPTIGALIRNWRVRGAHSVSRIIVWPKKWSGISCGGALRISPPTVWFLLPRITPHLFTDTRPHTTAHKSKHPSLSSFLSLSLPHRRPPSQAHSIRSTNYCAPSETPLQSFLHSTTTLLAINRRRIQRRWIIRLVIPDRPDSMYAAFLFRKFYGWLFVILLGFFDSYLLVKFDRNVVFVVFDYERSSRSEGAVESRGISCYVWSAGSLCEALLVLLSLLWYCSFWCVLVRVFILITQLSGSTYCGSWIRLILEPSNLD